MSIKTKMLYFYSSCERVCILHYLNQSKFTSCTPQAEGSEVSAEVEFINQQNLILSMENKALKQRLESLAQEQIIKYCKF